MSPMCDHIADGVIRAFGQLPMRYRTPAPAREILQKLIEIAFYSSVVREEERQVRVRLVVCDSGAIVENGSLHTPHIEALFAAPQPVLN